MPTLRNGAVMATVDKPTKICDIEGCGKPARHECASCGKDLCATEHTHSFGDGGHIEHACPVTIMTFPFGGAYKIWLCPKCITSPMKKSLYAMEKYGEAMDTTNHHGMG